MIQWWTIFNELLLYISLESPILVCSRAPQSSPVKLRTHEWKATRVTPQVDRGPYTQYVVKSTTRHCTIAIPWTVTTWKIKWTLTHSTFCNLNLEQLSGHNLRGSVMKMDNFCHILFKVHHHSLIITQDIPVEKLLLVV